MHKGTIAHRAGFVVSTLVALLMIADGLVGLLQPQVFASYMSSVGWGSATLFPVAMLAFISGVFYPVSRTAVLGAILLTGFVGGMRAAHLLVTQAVILPEIINVALGVGAWGGLWLRDSRLCALLPSR